MAQATAQLNYLRIAPRKVRRVASVIKRMSISEAEAQLLLMRGRPAPTLLKLLRSAIANAKTKNLNQNALIIEAVRVDGGPILKRFLPRAQGRATPIHKHTSHVTIVLAESTEIKPRFTIIPKAKKTEKKPGVKKTKAKTTEPKPILKEEKKGANEDGFMRKIFRRKSV